MNAITDLLAPLFGMLIVVLGYFFMTNKKKSKELDKELEELNKRREAEKEYLRRQAAKVEDTRRELEEKLKDIEELDMDTESARDYIRGRYGSTDTPT